MKKKSIANLDKWKLDPKFSNLNSLFEAKNKPKKSSQFELKDGKYRKPERERVNQISLESSSSQLSTISE